MLFFFDLKARFIWLSESAIFSVMMYIKTFYVLNSLTLLWTVKFEIMKAVSMECDFM